MADGSSSRALVLWQPPQDIIRAAQTTLELLVKLDVRTAMQCPLAQLNTKIGLMYLYADRKPVESASFVLETVPGSPVMAGALQNGAIMLTVPRGQSYCFYFHQDALPDGSLFQFFPQTLVQPGPAADPVPPWSSDVAAEGAAKKLRMHWGKLDFHLTAADNAVPVLEKLIYHVITSALPVPGHDSLQVEATWLIEAMILGDGSSADLWKRLVFNRLGVALDTESRLLQALLQFVSATTAAPASGVLQTAIYGMNAAGKGNAVDWLRALSGKAQAIENAVAVHVAKLFAGLQAELARIADASPAQAWTHNTDRTKKWRDKVSGLSQPGAKVTNVLTAVWQRLNALVSAHPALVYHQPGQVEQYNVIRQTASPFPPYRPAPVVLPKTWFEIQYLYSDGKPVERASFIVRNQAKAQIAAELVGPEGIGYVEVDTGQTYEFRFHADEPELVIKAPARAAQIEPDGKTWLDETIQGTHIEEEKAVCRWSDDSDVSNLETFKGNPSFGRLLRLQVIAAGLPRRTPDSEDDKAAEKTLVAIIRTLLFADKLPQTDRDQLWLGASLHRLSAAADPHGAIVERFLALLITRDDLKLPEAVKWLNSSGKGNAYKWIEKLQKELADVRKAVAKNLQTVLDGFSAEIGKIASTEEAAMQRIGVLNRLSAGVLKKRVNALPKADDALAAAWAKVDERLKALVAQKETLKVFQPAGTLMGVNQYKQTAVAWPARPVIQLPQPAWVELLFVYANGTPVAKADYKVTVGANVSGKTDGGYAFEIVDRDKSYKYEFTKDEKLFEILAAKKGKENKQDFGAGMTDTAIAADSFKAGKPSLRWGSTHFTSTEDFKNAPSVSQIVSAAVRSASPIEEGNAENSHEELTALLYPLLMGQLLVDEVGDRLTADQFSTLWEAACFQRAGQVLGPTGPVIRDFLYWLHITDNPPQDVALQKLNSVGIGNVHVWLAKLLTDMDDVQQRAKDSLKAICQGIQAELTKIRDAADPLVAAGSKALARDAVDRIVVATGKIDAAIVSGFQKARARLKVLSELNEPVYTGDAALCELSIYRLKQQKLDRRPAALPPVLDWIELEYLHHDDAPVAGAKYKVVKEADINAVLYQGKLTNGYAYLIVPKDLKFKYYFHAETPLVLNAAANLNANALPPVPNLVRVAVLLKKFKKWQQGWGSSAFTDRQAFQNSPSMGQIACHTIRAAAMTPHCAANAPEAEELAKLLHPIVMRQAANSAGGLPYKDNTELWNAAILNRMGVLLGAEGAVTASLLSAMHAACPRDALGVLDLPNILKKAKFLEYLNSLGKGHGVTWLQTLDPLKAVNENAVKTNLQTIFDRLIAELTTELEKQYTTLRKLQSGVLFKYSVTVRTRLQAVRPEIAVQVGRLFGELRIELAAILAQAREPAAGVLLAKNTLKQTQAALPARVTPPIPRWVELTYCYPKLDTVTPAQYALLKQADGTVVKAGNLDANGFIYVTDLPADALNFAFAKDPIVYQPRADQADKTEYKKTVAERRTHAPIPVPGYQSYSAPAAFPVNNFVNGALYTDYNRYYVGGFTLMSWEPSAPATLAGYRAWPTFGKLARNCVARNTNSTCTKPVVPVAVQPEQNEMLEMICQVTIGGQHANNTYWSVAVMNRVGTTDVAGLQNNESRLRKAVLLQLLNAPGTNLPTLVAMLNSAGQGHAVRWLRQLNGANAALKNAVAAAITVILTELKQECINLLNRFYHGQGDLGAAVHNPATALNNAITNNIITPALVAAKVNLVLDPIFAALNLLLPARPLNPRPFAQAATADQLNVYVQPKAEFPLLELMNDTPPAWHLRQPVQITVQYRGINGGNITANYHVTTVADQNGVNGVRNFTVNTALASNAEFFFDQDQPAPASFDASFKPFLNPYTGALPADYLTLAAGANSFLAPVNLPWKPTAIIDQASFNAAPSLGQILARSIIGHLPNVSGANDVQDLTVALMRLIEQPATRAVSDEWFRAAVNVAGGKVDHGSVLKGILLRVRKHRQLAGADFLKLFNLASSADGNASVWLQAQIINMVDIGGAQAGLTDILTNFVNALNTLIALPTANPGQQSNLNLQGFLNGVQAQAMQVRNLVNANVPACFATAKAALGQTRLGLQQKQPAHLGLNLYQRQKAAVFLESYQGLNQADKRNVDVLTKNRIAAANITPVGPAAANLAANISIAPYNNLFRNHANTPTVWRTLHGYLTGARGGQAKALAPELAKMSNDEFVAFVDNLATPPWTRTETHWGGGGGKMGAMVSYEHADGTLIRYKPGGDEYVNPPTPMYSIEVKAAGGDAQFKIDPNGNAVPWGPGQANAQAVGGGLKNDRYFDNVSKAGHRTLRF